MRYLSALAFVVCLFAPSTVFAQEVTVLAELDAVSRQGANMSPTVRVPVDVAAGELQFVLFGLSTADYENPLTRIAVRVYKFDTSLIGNWRHMGGATWQGGRYVDEDGNVNPDPVFSLGGAGGYANKDIRCELDIQRRVTVGCRIQHFRPGAVER